MRTLLVVMAIVGITGLIIAGIATIDRHNKLKGSQGYTSPTFAGLRGCDGTRSDIFTVWVDNPNPFPIPVRFKVYADYDNNGVVSLTDSVIYTSYTTTIAEGGTYLYELNRVSSNLHDYSLIIELQAKTLLYQRVYPCEK